MNENNDDDGGGGVEMNRFIEGECDDDDNSGKVAVAFTVVNDDDA